MRAVNLARAPSLCAALAAVVALACVAHARAGETASSSEARRHPLIADHAKESRFVELEELFTKGEWKDGLARTDALLVEKPEDPELLIHRFRLLFEKGERFARTDRSVDKEALYEEMLRITARGLAIAPEHPRFLWGKGIATARLGTQRGILASLTSATTIEAAWTSVTESGYRYESLRGEEILPCDAQLALGMFYRMVPDWWIVGVIAGTKGDLARSLALLEESDRCAPDRVRAVKELGVTELCLAESNDDEKMRARGVKTLTRALTLGSERPVDAIDRAHVRALLDDHSLACGYSRDGQQERDEKALAKRRAP